MPNLVDSVMRHYVVCDTSKGSFRIHNQSWVRIILCLPLLANLQVVQLVAEIDVWFPDFTVPMLWYGMGISRVTRCVRLASFAVVSVTAKSEKVKSSLKGSQGHDVNPRWERSCKWSESNAVVHENDSSCNAYPSWSLQPQEKPLHLL